VLAALDDLAATHDVEVATVALAWSRRQPTVLAPIASARTAEQLPALLAAVDLELSASELATLDRASA
jgi:aryl-alcohol dehydrogenase-like predicted oxidoreductase